ncbi:MAG: hypothetical protein QM831_36770 [Kofleriaceae bacterium]
MRPALLFVVCACGHHDSRVIQDGPADDDSGSDSGGGDQHDAQQGTPIDARIDAPPDAGFPYKLDVGINCHNDCTLIANPASIAVPAGTKFTVNWINTGDTDCDVAKIDQFNQVPIVLGLEPGTSYYDSIREWCGPQFTGTFDFRISICTLPSYIPVNCGAN